MGVTATARDRPDTQTLTGAFRRRVLRLGRLIIAWSQDRRGVSAVEFALVAPILGFALLASLDLGLAVSERMAIHHALRAGAQHAMSDPGDAAVLNVMRSSAEANFTIDDGTASGAEALDLSVLRYAACPEDVGFVVPVSTICAGSKPTFIFYRLSGQMTYTGWLMAAMTFDRTVEVQIR